MNLSALDPGLLVVGAVGIIIIVSAYFVGKVLAKSRGKKPEQETPSNSQKITEKPAENKKDQPEWKMKRSFLQRIRDRKKKENDEVPVIPSPEKEATPATIPDPVFDSIVEPAQAAALPVEVAPVVSPIPQAADVPVADKPLEGKTDSMSSLFADLMDKPEQKPSEPAVEEAVKEEPKKEKSGGGGDIFSMFTDEDEEEDEKAKFASSLEPVSIDDLLGEVRDLRKFMRK